MKFKIVTKSLCHITSGEHSLFFKREFDGLRDRLDLLKPTAAIRVGRGNPPPTHLAANGFDLYH